MSLHLPNEARTVTFEIPLPPRHCQANGPHYHWAVKAKARKQYREEAFYAARENAVPPMNAPVRLTVTAYTARKAHDGRYRPTDIDGLVGAMKGAIDGMRDAKVLADDIARMLCWGEVRILCSKDSDGRTALVITLTEEQA